MKLTIALTTNIGQTESHPIGFIPFYLHTLTFVVLNCLHVLFIVESDDPKGTFSFYAFIMNNKVLLYLYLKWTITLTTDADRTESYPMKWIICLTAETDRTESHPMEWIICLIADTDRTESHPMEWIICLTADTDRTESHPMEWIICLTTDTDLTESHPME